jgi:3',5'-cyclic AMP phosphodiesterase CpdA
MAAHTTFVHLSDTHIAPPGEFVHGADTAQNLRAVIARVREMDVDPAFFLISGDLANQGEPESYRHLRALLEEELDSFGVPVLLGLGNHDARLPFRRELLGESDAADDEEPYCYIGMIGGLRVLMLDSKVNGRIDGLLGARQLAWLEEELAAGPAPDGDLIVFHHPCLPRGVPRPDDYLLLDADALEPILQRHRVLGVLTGHSHVSSAGVFGGTVHVTAPATAFLLDPSIPDGGRALEGCGFNLVTVRDGRLIVNAVIMPGEQREIFRYGGAALMAANAGAGASAS